MANIIISEVLTKNYLKVDFGNYSSLKKIPKHKFFWVDDILSVDVHDNKVIVEMKEAKVDEWALSFDGFSGTLQVDSIKGVLITSNSQLANLIADLKG